MQAKLINSKEISMQVKTVTPALATLQVCWEDQKKLQKYNLLAAAALALAACFAPSQPVPVTCYTCENLQDQAGRCPQSSAPPSSTKHLTESTVCGNHIGLGVQKT